MGSARGPQPQCDLLLRHARIATMSLAAHGGEGALAELADGALACQHGKIVFVGPAAHAPDFAAREQLDCEGRLITPGLIDCHTHLVYAGDRAQEFERRLAGESYEAIARAGGGILSTVVATRGASEAQLVQASLPRLDALLAEGVTTLEIKSGYGLSLEHERKQLSAARALGRARPVTIKTTALPAHALPPEYAGQQDAYVRVICEEILPALAHAGLCDAVDAFCERIGFNLAQTERVFQCAAALGLPVKLHAEQLSNSHGAALAARHRALSADHLEHADEDAVRAMAEAGTCAVLLPGAFYFTRETQPPPLELLRKYGVPVALATDCNPGTSPLTSLLWTMNLAATLFRMTVPECLLGVTRSAARALGISDAVGTLEAGKRADLAIWDVERPAQLVYRMGGSALYRRVWAGAWS